MKDEATPEQIAMARRIALTQWPPLSQGVRYHQYCRSAAESAALAAIIETQRLDAELADNFATKRGFANADCLDLAAAIRAGKHYGKDEG